MKDFRLKFATAASLILIAAPGISNAGYYYEAVTSNEAAGMPGGSQASTVHAWVDGDSAKVEFQDAAQAGIFEAGSYLVTTDAGDTLYLVNPEEMTITTIDFEEILGMAGSMMEAMGGVVNMEFGDFSNNKLSEESGGDILGHATTHSHYQTGYTMTIAVMGFRQESRMDTDNHVWCSDDFDEGGLLVWLRPDRFRTGNEDFDQMIRQQYETMNCLPLRNEVVTTMTGNGDTTVTTTRTEVIEIREESVPASLFEMPTGYEEVSLMEGLTGGAGDQGEQPDDSPMPDFRDIFRR